MRYLVFCEGHISQAPIRQQGRARGRNEGDAAPAEIYECSITGYTFDNEENLVEFVEDQLKKNPHLKWHKYTPSETFFTEPSPMKREKYE